MLVWFLLASLAGQSSPSQPWTAKHRPTFADFPVQQIWRGKPARVLAEPFIDRWPMDLNEWAKGPVNFAGRYQLVFWMSGSNCASGAIVELPTGRVFAPLFGQREDAAPYFISCGMFHGKGFHFRPNSRLMIFETGMHNPPDTYYFVWENDHFRRLLFIGGEPDSKPFY